MRVHSDTITRQQLYKAANESLPTDVWMEASDHGSRSRDHAFEVALSAEPGTDRFGHKRRPRNTGQYGGPSNDYEKAATWYEWGDFFAALFKLDPRAIIGPSAENGYDGVEDYVYQTAKYDPAQRDKPEYERVSVWDDLI